MDVVSHLVRGKVKAWMRVSTTVFAAVIAGRLNPATRALLDYLSGADARTVWVKFGFGVAR